MPIQIVCEKCRRPIETPEDGVIVQGNIYCASAEARPGGLVGDVFPDKETFTRDEVGRVVYCRSCIERLLWDWDKD